MKKERMTVRQWIKSLFFKSKKQVETLSPELDNIQDPYLEPVQKMETYTINEITKKVFDSKLKLEVLINGKIYRLTEKQKIFYNAIVENQKTYTDGVLGWKIVYEFLKNKHGFNDVEMQAFKKSKFRINEHNKTMVYLLSSGLVQRIGNKYKAKV